MSLDAVINFPQTSFGSCLISVVATVPTLLDGVHVLRSCSNPLTFLICGVAGFIFGAIVNSYLDSQEGLKAEDANDASRALLYTTTAVVVGILPSIGSKTSLIPYIFTAHFSGFRTGLMLSTAIYNGFDYDRSLGI